MAAQADAAMHNICDELVPYEDFSSYLTSRAELECGEVAFLDAGSHEGVASEN
jgi:hypothetical protein